MRLPKFSRGSSLNGRVNTREIPVDPARVAEWEALGGGAPKIQDAFPDLGADDREFLLFGITPEEEASAFPPEAQE